MKLLIKLFIIHKRLLLAALLAALCTAFVAAEESPSKDAWKDKRLYIAVRPALSFHFYDTKETFYDGIVSVPGTSFDIAAQFAFQFHRLFALQAELIITTDSMVMFCAETMTDQFGYPLFTYDTMYRYSSDSLVIPILAKFMYKPGIFSLAGFGGVYFPSQLGESKYTDRALNIEEHGTITAPMGFAVGGSAGVKFGPGVLFFDARFMMDFDVTQFTSDAQDGDIYKRSMISLGIGYEIGLF
jgi:hypothetical protein